MKRLTPKAVAKFFYQLNHAIVIFLLFIAAISLVSAGQAEQLPDSARTTSNARLSGTTIILPIVMVREFPFVEGEVAGVRGKFMLDTGMQEALSINDHLVPLAGGTKTGTGFFGSGQTFDIRRHSSVENIRVGEFRLPRVSHVQSQDARMLERITPDFIGWIGYDFFKDYALKMDYRQSRAIFYKEGASKFLRGEKVIAILPFETRRLPNHPLLPAKIGAIDGIASLDTGMHGTLNIPEVKKAELVRNGLLKAGTEPETYDMISVRLGDKVDVDIRSLEVQEGPSPAAKPIGITEEVELELGYAFLSQYKTVWDFRQKRLYLLAR